MAIGERLVLEQSRSCPPQSTLGDHVAAALLVCIALATMASAFWMLRSFGRSPAQDAFARISVPVRISYILLAFTVGPLLLYVMGFYLLRC